MLEDESFYDQRDIKYSMPMACACVNFKFCPTSSSILFSFCKCLLSKNARKDENVMNINY